MIRRLLALAVIGGLVVSTVITLLLVPVFLEILGELERRRAVRAEQP